MSVLLVAAAVAPAAAQPGPRGPRSVVGIWQWRSNQGRFSGRLFFVQDGQVVKGSFLESNAGTGGELDGNVDGRRLSFRRAGRWGNRGHVQDYTVSLDWSGSRMEGSFVDPQDPNASGDFQATRLFPAPANPGPEVQQQQQPPPPPPPQLDVPPPPPPRPSVRPIDERALGQLIESIRGQSFTESQIGVIDQAVSYHYFLVDQVARILPLFSFEESRLQVLEKLRPRILDPQNGFKLTEQFTYSASKLKANQIMQRR